VRWKASSTSARLFGSEWPMTAPAWQAYGQERIGGRGRVAHGITQHHLVPHGIDACVIADGHLWRDWAGRLYWKRNDSGKARQISSGPASCSFGQARVSFSSLEGWAAGDSLVLGSRTTVWWFGGHAWLGWFSYYYTRLQPERRRHSVYLERAHSAIYRLCFRCSMCRPRCC
jgi:hypothetical protein